MKKSLVILLNQIIRNEIVMGSDAKPSDKAKAQKFMDELSENGQSDLEYTLDGETYSVWNCLLCVKYDTI